jgi:hypothetical protein
LIITHIRKAFAVCNILDHQVLPQPLIPPPPSEIETTLCCVMAFTVTQNRSTVIFTFDPLDMLCVFSLSILNISPYFDSSTL